MKLSELKSYKVVGATPSTENPATSPAAADNRDLLSKASDFITKNNLPGAQLGAAVGSSLADIAQAVKTRSFDPILNSSQPNFGKVVGDTVRSVALPVSFAAAAPATIAGAVGQFGALGAVQAAGESMARGSDVQDVAKDALIGGATGAGAGAAFNLLGKGISYVAGKTAPTALSFTSGVPKNAIQQATANPAVAKEGLGMSVGQVRDKAVTVLQGLHNDLGKEFKQGLALISDIAPVDNTAAEKLVANAQSIAKKFNVFSTASPDGLVADFSKSAIVKGGEETAVQKTLQTISTWDDFSAKGLEELAQRVGALRNFESGAQTKSSAIVGEIYNSVNNVIKTAHPELAALRTNYANNRKVLDEISNVLSASKDQPTQIQASVSRLNALFKDNKDEYVNAIRQLSQRSGVDFLSLLAGGEFQKVLPSFIRGLGGAGVVGVGASLLNPYLLLLAPLFSPRVVGSAIRNAPAAAKATSQLTRAGTTQAIQQLTPKAESQRAK